MNNIIDINNYKEEIENLILSKKISYDSNSKYFIYLSIQKKKILI